MITEKSIFTIEIPEWINKVRIGTVPTLYYTKGEALPSKHEGATLRKVGNKQYYVDEKHKKIIKNPLQRGNPEYWNLNGQAFYSTNMTWKQRSTIVNYYHKYFASYVNKQIKDPFPTFLAYTLNMDVVIYEVYSKFTPDITNMWILSKMIEDTVVKCKILKDDSPEFRRHTGVGYKFVEKEEDRKIIVNFNYIKN
jgi:hypothetical protein